MVKMLIFFTTTLMSVIMGHASVIVNLSGVELDGKNQTILREEQRMFSQIDQPRLGLIMTMKNSSQLVINDMKKQRKDRFRKKKEKGGKVSRQKGKLQKPLDYIDKQIHRNIEKVDLVRNRTIQILKNGIRILSAGEKYTQSGDKPSRANETELGKTLSSAFFRKDILSSVPEVYEMPIGIYRTDALPKSRNLTERIWNKANKTTVNSYLFQASDNGFHIKRQTKFGNEHLIGNDEQENGDDSALDAVSERNAKEDFNTTGKDTPGANYEHISLGQSLETLLEQIVTALKNLTKCTNGICSEMKTEHKFHNGDPCLKWLNCKNSLDHAFSEENKNLPSCPCHYPSTIFYDDTVWDERHKKYFRWRDASSESERLDIYKPGAAYCIRSLLTQGNSSISSQQCCYDRNLQLLTRGSGAGTINIISPDISKRLHYIVDILPWRLCKGDFTRYNSARNPNNGNGCHENPDEEHYQLQVKLSKIY